MDQCVVVANFQIFGDIDYSKLFMTASKNMEVRYLTSSIQILGGVLGLKGI